MGTRFGHPINRTGLIDNSSSNRVPVYLSVQRTNGNDLYLPKLSEDPFIYWKS